MSAPESLVIQDVPPLIVHGERLGHLPVGHIDTIRMGIGKIAVDTQASPFDERMTHVALFAALGLTNQEIMPHLKPATEATIKTDITFILSSLGTETRCGIARHLFEEGVFVRAAAAKHVAIQPADDNILDLISYGKTNSEVSDLLERPESNIKKRLVHITEKSLWRGREQIVLAALLSGEIGNFPLVATRPEK